MREPTPMMKQYFSIKDNHPDSLLLFRLGDFYELFYDDAVTAAKVLEITLTSRDKSKDPIPMCGVPYHSARNYIAKLIDNGFKVAICEQMEDPTQTKGMVRREVVRVITPGTLIDDFGMDDGASNFILAVHETDGRTEVSYADISTGEIFAFSTGDETELKSEIETLGARELVTNAESEHIIHRIYNDPPLYTVFEAADPADYDYEDDVDEHHAINLLLNYIRKQNMQELKHLKTVEKHRINTFMKLNYAAISNLELLENIQTKKVKGSLFWYLNRTETPMGKRQLRKLIERPLVSKKEIENRQNIVTTLIDNFTERQQLSDILNDVYDIERLVGRLAFNNVDVKDLGQLRDSLRGLPELKSVLDSLKLTDNKTFQNFDSLEDAYDRLVVLTDTPPKTIREGKIFKDGVNDELDNLRDISTNARTWLNNYLETEKERTGIKNLKIGFNKVFGYYLEISKVQAMNFDAEKFEYNRKQTLTNAERFITPELKEMESRILTAEDDSIKLEFNMFTELRTDMMDYITRLQRTAEQISTLDTLISFALVSNDYHLTTPEFSNDKSIELIDARHPIVERMLNENTYVPNDLTMTEDNFIYLITGPNMSGKSTYMRQVALIIIMAQMGMRVPAASATLPVFDAIYTRIGASDDLSSGKSTFMIEMMEANNALQHATKDSLLIFDEIGRGTSTYDGMALAQAMLVYIHEEIGAKTLFSTHYHELTNLEDTLSGLQNVHVKATEYDGKLVFLHKVKPGAVEKSYGIHVAKLAELPDRVTELAGEYLSSFENRKHKPEPGHQDDIFQLELPLDDSETVSKNDKKLLTELTSLDLNNMTPMEAMNTLHGLVNKARGEG
ncbi:DNA mismatch repair protein MutS [Jeotgalicoccus coquinae]|uniref:DNA mismatch repair protein MutS n=1 Tax=Jeotgalicoccus coquinae TaxID=709509 RepID=A0A6V7RJT1_9STAP|nr:DNA mismatch repair protein MutS [Jeotgalicoccus coquinae]MBB6422642.1 DNA mismatch repair protein MutS [Jeotgalicoccus coquinae]GGE14306.1 DNA mismatch repair protein MutS [Jeotgalicoccus coquinae]CAD2077694.1 DNA mismatch repair protein MutS [Jeotgalicoccus coquinae]